MKWPITGVGNLFQLQFGMTHPKSGTNRWVGGKPWPPPLLVCAGTVRAPAAEAAIAKCHQSPISTTSNGYTGQIQPTGHRYHPLAYHINTINIHQNMHILKSGKNNFYLEQIQPLCFTHSSSMLKALQMLPFIWPKTSEISSKLSQKTNKNIIMT